MTRQAPSPAFLTQTATARVEQPSELLTLKQAADMAGYADAAILRQAIRRGQLALCDMGTARIIVTTKTALRAYLLSLSTRGNRRAARRRLETIPALSLRRCPVCARGWVATEAKDQRCRQCATLKAPRPAGKLTPL